MLRPASRTASASGRRRCPPIANLSDDEAANLALGGELLFLVVVEILVVLEAPLEALHDPLVGLLLAPTAAAGGLVAVQQPVPRLLGEVREGHVRDRGTARGRPGRWPRAARRPSRSPRRGRRARGPPDGRRSAAIPRRGPPSPGGPRPRWRLRGASCSGRVRRVRGRSASASRARRSWDMPREGR